IVNAGTEGGVKIDATSKVPPLRTILSGISTTPMENYSFDTVQQLLTLFLDRHTIAQASGHPEADIRSYPVNISFSLLPNKTDADKKLIDTINNIGTSFNALTDEQFNALQQAAEVLVHQDPCFQQFMRDVNGTPFPAGVAPCVYAPP